ncbi:Smad nuclear-interacting protein 1 [Mycoemilia scoparia]|uniref:Smad nuclear-interacting protein 1 n=1 Tax=Mycoemilia scoparia TaxID=417184 RepID=A0A9W8DNT1_9FUNG|nr:Smad nuclear-interacting protein 1 [Mycoemilia scoparia]
MSSSTSSSLRRRSEDRRPRVYSPPRSRSPSRKDRNSERRGYNDRSSRSNRPRSRSPKSRDHRTRQRYRSKSPVSRNRSKDRQRSNEYAKRDSKHNENDDVDKDYGSDVEDFGEKKREEPNFGLSGKLAAETNTVNGVVVKYNEPQEARKPNMFQISRSSAYMFGRDRKVVDIPTDHPSCSGQHAVIQFRLISKGGDGATNSQINPYLIDLGSTNGTYLNSEKIPSQRYVELREKDVIKFGLSTREYVLLSENV